MTLASVGPAVRAAAVDLKNQIFALASDMLEAQPDYLLLENGVIYRLPGMDRSLPLADFVKRLGDAELMGKGSRLPNPEELSIQTFGAQFAEVEVDTQTGAVRVVRVVAVHESGRIINPLTVEGQINGGVIQAMGLALMEDRIVDQRSGQVLNANLENYLIPTALDIPAIDHEMVHLPTPQINNIGSKGVGEPPIIPTAGAIGNAIFHATGIRVYELPLTPARMLAALGAAAGGAGHAE
jgi:CO/xanthine dehydrogenase Mo-binding subunit